MTKLEFIISGLVRLKSKHVLLNTVFYRVTGNTTATGTFISRLYIFRFIFLIFKHRHLTWIFLFYILGYHFSRSVSLNLVGLFFCRSFFSMNLINSYFNFFKVMWIWIVNGVYWFIFLRLRIEVKGLINENFFVFLFQMMIVLSVLLDHVHKIKLVF